MLPDATAAPAPSARAPTRLRSLVACELLLVPLADWLFWDQRIGLSLPLFAAAVTLAALTGLARAPAPRRITWRRGAAAVAVLAAGLLPLVEDPGALSLVFGAIGTATAVELGASGAAGRWSWILRGAALRAAGGCGRIWRDAALVRRLARRHRGAGGWRATALLAWVVPIALLTTFLMLFASANPIISAWLANLPRPGWPSAAALVRAALWALVAALTWPLIRARPSSPRAAGEWPVPAGNAALTTGLAGALLSPAAILRTLVACNLLFAVQLVLDGAYLWGGVALPPGMGYAAYAHRGAYPLVASALLSALFVLVARGREGSRDGPSRLISALTLAFTGQNVLLVISSMRRLAVYVDAYSLTEWRVAAFVWMLLVAIGLALIMLQAALGRGNAWLVGRTCAAAAAVLYGCCFVDVPATVAGYDVDQCAEVRGTGPELDLGAILDLGPAALPAIDRFLASPGSIAKRSLPATRRLAWAADAAAQARDWRGWSLRAWRLGRYLDRVGPGPAAAGPDDPEASRAGAEPLR